MIIDKHFILTVLLVSFSLLVCAQKINGVSLVASKDSITILHVKSVIDVNANYTALMPFGFIRELSSPKIRFNSKRQWFGEREQGIRQYAKELQHKGIKLMIKPQIWVWRGQFTGHISMDSEDQWKVLEESYSSFILMYAAIAEETNAAIFCIGTELEKFVINRPVYWKILIQKIKKVYKGKLTYAANWDEFKRVPFWNELDYIGTVSYTHLTLPTIYSV